MFGDLEVFCFTLLPRSFRLLARGLAPLPLAPFLFLSRFTSCNAMAEESRSLAVSTKKAQTDNSGTFRKTQVCLTGKKNILSNSITTGSGARGCGVTPGTSAARSSPHGMRHPKRNTKPLRILTCMSCIFSFQFVLTNRIHVKPVGNLKKNCRAHGQGKSWLVRKNPIGIKTKTHDVCAQNHPALARHV